MTISAFRGDGGRRERGRLLGRGRRGVRQHQLHGQGLPLPGRGERPVGERVVDRRGRGQWVTSFGFSVATAGDVNGDGYSDVVVGAYAKPVTRARPTCTWRGCERPVGEHVVDRRGRGHVDWPFRLFRVDGGRRERRRLLGRRRRGVRQQPVPCGQGLPVPGWLRAACRRARRGPPWARPRHASAYSVSTAGDVNGDGYSDVVVGAYGQHQCHGQGVPVPGWGRAVCPASASWTAVGEATGDRFGGSVSTAGDVNGDGYSDVVVGASGATPRWPVRARRTCTWVGRAACPASASWTAVGEAAGDDFGIPCRRRAT